ncbi:C40 family peptidase [Kitasatospora sp. NPDC094011]|uniref:C40 family peptidase n=1 Tax=Kitasatospora sp. NPDC094011 TaxID=3364090 RepID=UPI003806AB6E
MHHLPMHDPVFVEETAEDCPCAVCAADAATTAAPSRRTPGRCRRAAGAALAAAIGAAALIGTGASAASAEPAPGRAGWDGAKYWYKDESGAWRWTHHYTKYRDRTGNRAAPAARSGAPAPARSGEPVFRGREGWDAHDRVYWYRKGGHWYWTGHESKYRQYRTGTPAPEHPSGGRSPAPAHPSRVEAALSYATAQLGVPYVWGGNGPDGWDCSGLVQQAFRRAGRPLPRVAADQYRATTPVSRAQLRRGDLVFWSSDGSAARIHHVAIYLGGDRYLEAPRPGRTVRVSSFAAYRPNLYGRVA